MSLYGNCFPPSISWFCLFIEILSGYCCVYLYVFILYECLWAVGYLWVAWVDIVEYLGICLGVMDGLNARKMVGFLWLIAFDFVLSKKWGYIWAPLKLTRLRKMVRMIDFDMVCPPCKAGVQPWKMLWVLFMICVVPLWKKIQCLGYMLMLKVINFGIVIAVWSCGINPEGRYWI